MRGSNFSVLILSSVLTQELFVSPFPGPVVNYGYLMMDMLTDNLLSLHYTIIMRAGGQQFDTQFSSLYLFS